MNFTIIIAFENFIKWFRIIIIIIIALRTFRFVIIKATTDLFTKVKKLISCYYQKVDIFFIATKEYSSIIISPTVSNETDFRN